MHALTQEDMKAIRIRRVPDDVAETPKARAARQGQSLSECLLALLEAEARGPTPADLTAQIRRRGGAEPGLPATEVLRAERED